MSNLKQNGALRWIPSYLRRQGQMTPGQKRAFREYWESFGIAYRYGQEIDLAAHFGGFEDPEFHLEIGFGMGENLIHQAETWKDRGILGIEVHKPGIGAVLKNIAERDLKNIRVMRGDARLVLADYLAQAVRFRRISVLFPDPWPDEESAHRRIIQPDFVDLVELRLRRGGQFHIATDVDLYRDHCEAVMSKRGGWRRLQDFNLDAYRGPTRYEQKGREQGHTIHDLIFEWSGDRQETVASAGV